MHAYSHTNYSPLVRLDMGNAGPMEPLVVGTRLSDSHGPYDLRRSVCSQGLRGQAKRRGRERDGTDERGLSLMRLVAASGELTLERVED